MKQEYMKQEYMKGGMDGERNEWSEAWMSAGVDEGTHARRRLNC